MQIVFAAPLPASIVGIAKSLSPAGCEFVIADQTRSDFRERMGSADFLVTGFVKGQLDDAFYSAAPRLKLVQLIGSGCDGVDVEAARRAGVPIATNGGANAIAVAEHTLMLMMAVMRRLPRHHASVASGRWSAASLADEPSFELSGKRLGLVGFGAIGREVARRAQAFDMKVAYYARRRLETETERSLGVEFLAFDALLSGSDVVSLHLPLNPATKHLIGAPELAKMKPGAVLINTARGPIVDQEALYSALEQNALMGAGLDVFEKEPAPPGERILGLPNVVLSPHIAGPTAETWHRSFGNAFANVKRVAAGEPPLWVIPELA